MKEFYIPASKDSLAFYFSAGIIKPKKYFSNTSKDIQDLYNSWILGFDVGFKYLGYKDDLSSDCLICVYLEESEFEYITEGKPGILVKYIPLSRIKSIIVENLSDFRNIINNIQMSSIDVGGSAFIDEKIFDEIKLEKKEIPDKEIRICEDLHDFFERFDRFMGAMAFVKYKNNNAYNKAFFDELSSLSKEVEKEFYNKTKLKPNTSKPRIKSTILKDLKGINYQKEIESLSGKSISELSDKFGVLKRLKEKTFGDDKYVLEAYKLFYELDSKGEKIFDECETMNVDNLFAYGYNKGYYNLRSSYGKKNVKFNINNYIDRLAIELIYYYSQNNALDVKELDKNLDFLSVYRNDIKHEKKPKAKEYYLKEYYLFDAREPIEIIDFYADLEFYKNNKTLLKNFIKDFFYLKQNIDLAKALEEYQENFQVQANKVANFIVDKKIEKQLEEKLNDLKNLFLNVTKDMNQVSDTYKDIREKQVNFYKHVVQIPNLNYELDELKEENEKLKNRIKELESQLKNEH